MNGELTKNTFGPAKAHTGAAANASFAGTGFPDTQSVPDEAANAPAQPSPFGAAPLSGGKDGEPGAYGGGLWPLQYIDGTSADSTSPGDIPLNSAAGGTALIGEEKTDATALGEAIISTAQTDSTFPDETSPDDSDSSGAALSQRRGRKKSAAILTAFLCLSSVAAYICAGLFVADTVMGKLPALFANELMAAAPLFENDGADTAPVIPAVKPNDRETTDIAPPNEITRYPVESVSLAAHDPFAVANETKYTPDIAALTSAEAFAAAKPDAAASAGEPLVLVIHTHATEAFLAEGMTSYNDDTTFRSTDPSQNMIAVGDELCRVLGDAGIETLHCTEMFDKESFIHSYEKSASAVSEYLKAHPSIRYVLDVHRDAIFRQDSTLLAARSTDGSAQVMLVCGTDEMGADFGDWQDNLAFAFSLQASAKSRYPDLMRNVNLRGASFNEQLAERFLLVEVGSAGNTLAEAKSAARRFGEVFASVVAP